MATCMQAIPRDRDQGREIYNSSRLKSAWSTSSRWGERHIMWPLPWSILFQSMGMLSSSSVFQNIFFKSDGLWRVIMGLLFQISSAPRLLLDSTWFLCLFWGVRLSRRAMIKTLVSIPNLGSLLCSQVPGFGYKRGPFLPSSESNSSSIQASLRRKPIIGTPKIQYQSCSSFFQLYLPSPLRIFSLNLLKS